MDHSSAETKLEEDIQENMSSASMNDGRNSLIDFCLPYQEVDVLVCLLCLMR